MLAPGRREPLTAPVPAVSVLLVFHRDTPFLRPAIASVLAQTFSDFELLLVDNGTGLTAAALGEAGRDPRLRWIRLPRNAGIPAGHNAGVAAACGEFVALLDYDDLALPARLERQVAALRADPGLGLVSSLAERIDESDRRSGGGVFCLPDPAGHRAYSLYAAPVVTPAAMARRGLLQALPYRAEFPLAADLDFQARAMEQTRFAVLPETLLHYRWYPEQTTQRRSAEIGRSRAAIALCTARRRAGRPEALAETLVALDQTPARSASAAWRCAAERALAETFPVLAAYAARRLFALDRAPRVAVTAARLASRAIASARGQRRLAARMFLTGPVRALGLRPAPAGKNTVAPAAA